MEPENDSYEERELPLPDMIFDSLNVQLMIIQKDMMDFIDLKGLASDAQGLMTSDQLPLLPTDFICSHHVSVKQSAQNCWFWQTFRHKMFF